MRLKKCRTSGVEENNLPKMQIHRNNCCGLRNWGNTFAGCVRVGY